MPDSDIEEICRKIYQKHSTALDLIFQYKPDMELEVSKIVQGIINKHKHLILESPGKTYIRFISNSLDNIVPKKGQGWGWVPSGRMLLFEFENYNKKMILKLVVGPGENEIRNALYEIAKMDTKLFNTSDRKLTPKWLTIYKREYLKVRDYEDADKVDLEASISKKFETFITDDLPRIEKHISDNWHYSELASS